MATMKKPAKKMQMGGKEPKKKTGMDALKAVGKYVSTFGGATERDDPKQKDINIVKKLKETGSAVKKKLGMKSGGAVKAKNGKSFPDLNKDGKITKADILKGRGVIAKKGMKVSKAQDGVIEKKSLKDKIFGTKEERQDRRLDRQSNREDRQLSREENREDRRLRRECVGGKCGGRARGFIGYKDGGKMKKAMMGTGMHMMPDGSMMKNSMMKMGGKMAKQAAVAIAMKKAGKTPKKKLNYGGAAASMKPTSMMKTGGKTKKCMYGCK